MALGQAFFMARSGDFGGEYISHLKCGSLSKAGAEGLRSVRLRHKKKPEVPEWKIGLFVMTPACSVTEWTRTLWQGVHRHKSGANDGT